MAKHTASGSKPKTSRILEVPPEITRIVQEGYLGYTSDDPRLKGSSRKVDISRALAQVALAKSHADAAARHAAAAQAELLLVLPEGYRELVKALRTIANAPNMQQREWMMRVAKSALVRSGIAPKGGR